MMWWLLACTGSSPEPGHHSRRLVDTGVPGLPEITQTEVQPSMTPSEVVAAIETALQTPPEPGEVTDAYIDLMAQGDPFCPGDPENIMDQWIYGCDAITGYSYAGVTDWFSGAYEGLGEMVGLAGDFWIDTPDGTQLEAGGHAVTVTAPGLWVGEMAGSWRWTGGSDWLVHGYSGNLTQQVIAGSHISFSGSADISGTHITGHDLVLPDACPGMARGGLSLRDPGGGWYRLQFEDCTRCAPLHFEETTMDEVCIDFSGYIATMVGRL